MIPRALVACLALLAGPLAAEAKPRIASINMCADQLLLALADREQIVGLSPFSLDPELSWYADRAKGHTILSGLAEDVLPLKPDIVLTAVFVKPSTRDMLKRSGVVVIELDSASTVEAVKAQIGLVGDLLDQEERADKAIIDVENAVDRAQAAASATPLRVLPLERRGWVGGQDSLITEMLNKAGLLNLGIEAAGMVGKRLDLESVVRLKPDRLILSEDDTTAEDQGAAFLRHPAFSKIVPEKSRLIMPKKMTVCGGPMLADAFDRLTSELQRTGKLNAP